MERRRLGRQEIHAGADAVPSWRMHWVQPGGQAAVVRGVRISNYPPTQLLFTSWKKPAAHVLHPLGERLGSLIQPAAQVQLPSDLHEPWAQSHPAVSLDRDVDSQLTLTARRRETISRSFKTIMACSTVVGANWEDKQAHMTEAYHCRKVQSDLERTCRRRHQPSPKHTRRWHCCCRVMVHMRHGTSRVWCRGLCVS